MSALIPNVSFRAFNTILSIYIYIDIGFQACITCVSQGLNWKIRPKSENKKKGAQFKHSLYSIFNIYQEKIAFSLHF